MTGLIAAIIQQRQDEKGYENITNPILVQLKHQSKQTTQNSVNGIYNHF